MELTHLRLKDCPIPKLVQQLQVVIGMIGRKKLINAIGVATEQLAKKELRSVE